MNGKALSVINLPINVYMFFLFLHRSKRCFGTWEFSPILAPIPEVHIIVPLLFRGFLATSFRGPRNGSRATFSNLEIIVSTWESSYVTNRSQHFHSLILCCSVLFVVWLEGSLFYPITQELQLITVKVCVLLVQKAHFPLMALRWMNHHTSVLTFSSLFVCPYPVMKGSSSCQSPAR